jgi:O-antigen/teichoic acid export membrane protein
LLQPKTQEPGTAVQEKLAADSLTRELPTVRKIPGMGNVPMQRVIFWIQKGGFAILDQGLISGSNFVISILLARWLVPEQYGAYAVAFGIFVLLSLVYQSLVLEPMAVFGGSSYRDCLRGYLRSLLWIHIAISLAIGVVFGASALVAREFAQSAVLAGALAGVTFASPCILFFWLARRTFYLELSASKAAAGAFVYTALSMGGLFIVYRRGLLSPFSAFALMGVAALGTGCYNLVRLRAQLRPSASAPGVGESWHRHWGYGRWALASCVANWIPAYIYYPLLSSFGGMAQSGQLKALMNFTLPVEQTKAALSLLFLPYAANVLARNGKSGAGSLGMRMTMVSLAVSGPYWAALLLFRHPVFHFLYSGNYSEIAHLLPAVAVGSIFWSACFGPGIALRAMESPASVFTAFALATFLSLLVGIPAAWKFGLSGAIWGTNLADLLSLLIVVVVLRRKITGDAGLLERLIPWKRAPATTLAEEVPAE